MLLLHGLCITFLTTFVYSFSIRNTFLTLYRNKKNINNPILKNIDEILENNPESKVTYRSSFSRRVIRVC